ncbi:MAG: DUF4332 domain-containing protein [Gomphosphaeria aponina SAG 52.96 = DSM 107014]|uniref:DUF4332 domain-containing protein n=1 Tax=Gomphosphaeria aponina SAG 52.96 = DSM 107014 TaxID=1521640 RepID=A0A941GTB7_9CHRO|nr:DUF4332 domain-containing protein [Gomphosphaeria aponina SAG 52.96 = DSM 107014]
MDNLPGLSQEEAAKLTACGITTTGELLAKASTPASKKALAHQLQVNVRYISKWVALADLARLPSIGCQYCGVLLHSGIMSVNQLSQTPTHKLHSQLLRLYVASMQRPDLCPPVEVVQQWVNEALNPIM